MHEAAVADETITTQGQERMDLEAKQAALYVTEQHITCNPGTLGHRPMSSLAIVHNYAMLTLIGQLCNAISTLVVRGITATKNTQHAEAKPSRSRTFGLDLSDPKTGNATSG